MFSWKDGSDKKYAKTLIVNDVERYRLVNNNTLLYAKGKILFDLNLIKKGYQSESDKKIDCKKNDGYQEELYAFFDDGFYTYKKEEWIKHQEKKISKINKPISKSATFKGWYTAPRPSKKKTWYKIETLEDLKRYSQIFEYSSETSIPTITLYAYWEIKTCEVTFKNITKECDNRTSRSYIQYKMINGAWAYTSGEHKIDVPYGATLEEALSAPPPNGLGWGERKNPKRYSPYYVVNIDTRDNDYNDWLLKNKYAFWRGWNIVKKGANGAVINEKKYIITEDVTFYPQFDAIVFWKRDSFRNGDIGTGWTGCWISEITPPVSLSKAQKKGAKVPCFDIKDEDWPVYKWKYVSSSFSPQLDSGDILIIKIQKV